MLMIIIYLLCILMGISLLWNVIKLINLILSMFTPEFWKGDNPDKKEDSK